MADRSVEVDILADDKTAKGFDSAAARAKKFSDDVDKTNRETGDRAGKSFGSSFGKSIGGAFAGIGSTVGRSLSGISTGLSNAITGASPQVQAAVGGVVAAAVATAAPLLGAGLAGAVIGASAGVGIVGGIMLAARDSRIQAASSALGQRIMATLNQQGGVFVRPLLAAIGQVSDRFAQLSPTIGRGLAAAARYVEPLVDAFLDAGEAVTTGLVAAIERGGPVIQAIGDGVRGMGQTIGAVFALLSTQSENSASALRVLFGIIEGAIQIVGQFVYTLSAAWGQIRTLGGLIGDDGAGTQDLAEGANAANSAFGGLNISLDGTRTSASGAATSMALLGQQTKSLAQLNADLDQSQIALNSAIAATNNAREAGGRVTDGERTALLNLNTEIQNHLAAMTAQGASSADVNAKANTLRNTFIAQARQMGLNEQQAQDLAYRYGMFPRNVDTKMQLTGAQAAQYELERVRAKAGSIPALINIAIRVTGSTQSRQAIEAALAKQGALSADAVGAFGQGAGRFAAGHAGEFGILAGARERVRPNSQRVNLINRIRVELDGQRLAESQVRAATAVYDDRQWRAETGKR